MPPRALLPAGYTVIAALLALLYGVHYFDATLYFAPPDYTHFLFIIISLLVPLASMRPAGLALYAASYGSLIAIFEIAHRRHSVRPCHDALAAGARISWRAARLSRQACPALGLLRHRGRHVLCDQEGAGDRVLGDQESFLSILWYRMYGALPPETGVDLSLAYLLASYRRWAELIAFGSPNIGTGLVLAALAVFVIETWRASPAPARIGPPLLMACWLGVAVLIVWAAVFLNHTAVHPYFMARLLVIPVIGAAVLLTTRWLSPRTLQRDPLPAS